MLPLQAFSCSQPRNKAPVVTSEPGRGEWCVCSYLVLQPAGGGLQRRGVHKVMSGGAKGHSGGISLNAKFTKFIFC
ncbi:hypothetical protein GDO81_025501 [Engystomops pustulosus]|uniref:Uncharacterized protein n=1 Tax=Engystomops pustulosus TaxID=76066 RepID=A0AAV6YNQ3_ENGPU|nr:hypothetical protein GDO81_025501 [Engystomops pustulosus]